MKIKAVAAAVVALVMATTGAMADWTPTKPISLWIAFGPGGETDAVARIVANELEKQTGWQVTAENKAGGSGMAMFSELAHSPANGTVLGLATIVPMQVNTILRPDELPFTVDSFDYLATIAVGEKAIVTRTDLPFSTLPELIDYAKKNGLSMAVDPTPGMMIYNLLNEKADGKIRSVAVNSTAQALTMLLGKHVDLAFGGGTHLQYIDSGQVKAIVSVNKKRPSYDSSIPTLVEEGFNFFIDPYFIIAAPAGLDVDVKAALAQALDKVVQSDAVKEAIANTLHTSVENIGADKIKQQIIDGIEIMRPLLKSN